MGIDYAVNVGYGTKITEGVRDILAKEFVSKDEHWEDFKYEIVYEIGSYIPGLDGWYLGSLMDDDNAAYVGFLSLHMDVRYSDGFSQTLKKKSVPNKKQIKEFAKKYGLKKPEWHVGLLIC